MRKNKVVLFADNNFKYYQMYYYYLSNEQKLIVPLYIDLTIFFNYLLLLFGFSYALI